MLGIGSDSQVLSFDWDKRHLRVVQWQVQRGKAKVKRMLDAAIPGDLNVENAEDMGRFIRKVLDHERIKVRAAIVDVPRNQAVLKNMMFPPVGVGELAGMVRLQVAKELPFPLDSAVIDFAILPQSEGGAQLEVLIAAIRVSVLDFYKSVCSAAGLSLERIGLRPYANRVAMDDMLGASVLGRVLYADVGPQLTEIGIMRDGALVFSLAGSVSLDPEDNGLPTLPGSEPVDPEQQLIDRLMVEINRSVEAHRRTDPATHFDHIVVAGCSGLEARLGEAMHKRFGVKPLVYDPGRCVPDGTSVTEPRSAFAAVIGLGLGHASEGRLDFDFLNPKRAVGASEIRRRSLPAVLGALMTLVSAVYLTHYIAIRPYELEAAQLDNQIAKVEKDLKRCQKGLNITEIVGLWEEEQVLWPDRLVQLKDTMPSSKDAHLLDMACYQQNGRISFGIAAASEDVIFKLEEDLSRLATKPDDDKKQAERIFKVTSTSSKLDDDNIEYSYQSELNLLSDRLLKLAEESKKKKKGGRSR